LEKDKLEEVYIYMYPQLEYTIPNNDLKTREEVLTRPDADKWIEAMKAKLHAQYH
jgi:hypothetical protein